jgi:hypothetical protein
VKVVPSRMSLKLFELVGTDAFGGMARKWPSYPA